jgi:hypothetical protein
VSEEREKNDDLENDEQATENDVEAHKKWHNADSTASDDSDDVEAHAKSHKF